jgi:hypothetical protein
MEVTEFIKGAGAALVSRNILNNRGLIKWLLRRESLNPSDNGWRIFSNIDTDEFLANPDNLAIVDFNAMIEMEPALLGIYSFPVGSDLQLVVDPDGKRRWFDNLTAEEIRFT